ncbi:amino acid ABC transporter substrate-binding protein [Pseudoduganella namucuonensis]|uniref:Amino acid ABC transporter substrate-binding protein, PAAT family n=1 Tax=Pseudoduganella namucuonensis TaxID=1035707 RepID=A0A1I7L9C3_9BURK|nr:amino acid ABC transporter substrate-binding protein [Pseudoduganella namucuonensis]SFV06307.1 amino acid ABC transporter substrate-binding protein, PAAT family [Pseudoduganella namucuonensis]
MTLNRLLAILVCSALAAPAIAQEPTGTLAKIKRTGTITLGVRDGSVPFSYLDDKQQYLGYSVDLCMKIVTAAQKQLGMTAVKVVMQPVTAANRIPLMANGTIDLECGSTTNNAERQKQVSFASSMFVVANKLLVKKSSNIKTLADMKGKTLVATAGTTTLKQMTILNNEMNLGMTILIGKDHPESFLMLETGRAAAEANDDILLAAQVAAAKSPGEYEITKEALSVEPYGIMLRRDDPAFKQLADAALARFYQTDDYKKVYEKWFMSPIPPKGINLNFPMPPQLQAVIAKPTDSPDPAAYAAVPAAQQAAAKKKAK